MAIQHNQITPLGSLIVVGMSLLSLFGCTRDAKDVSMTEQAALHLPEDAVKDIRTSTVPDSVGVADETSSEPVRSRLSDREDPVVNERPVEIATAPRARLTDQSPMVANTLVDFTQVAFPDANIAARMMPSDWVKFLATIDQALKSLLLRQQAGELSGDEFFAQARRLSEAKLQASESLVVTASDRMEQELGLLGKLEALSQLTGIGDRARADELRQFANDNANFQSPEVARQAALVLLGFSLNDLSNGERDTESIVAKVDTVLADPSKLRMPEFKMMTQVIKVLQHFELADAAMQVQQKTMTAFQDHPDPTIAYAIWQMAVDQSPAFLGLQTVFSQAQPSGSQSAAAIDEFLTAFPSDWSVVALAREINNLEYDNHQDTASVLASKLADSLPKITRPELRSEVDLILYDYQSRQKLLGQKLVLSDLVTLQGEPIDLATFKGQVVLVDFWATWCGTCRASFPQLSELYARYHDQGFEIIAVNVDTELSSVQAVLATNDLPWIHAFSGDQKLQGMNSTAAQQVGLRSTPLTFLLDREGRVVAIQPHGKQLEELLSQAFLN